MLRVYDGDKIGATAFFRNRPLLETLTGLLRASGKPTLEILFHASSIGAEPYSLAAYAAISGLAAEVQLNIHATDINPNFLEQARQAIYPQEILDAMTAQERTCFEPHETGKVRVREDIRARVTFLPAASFVDFTSEREFDVVFVLNALNYVTPEQQTATMHNIARYNRWLLVTTAFHPDTIESDMVACGYRPIDDNIEAIHNGWIGRVRPSTVVQPGSPEYSWVLPAFSRVDDYRYRFCALFQKG